VKRAAFRLQPVLELRRLQERAAALAASQAARVAADADRRAADREQSLSVPRMPDALSGEAFLAVMATMRSAADDASEARSVATASAEQAEAVRAEWTAAAQRTKGLERLRDRHEAALLSAERTAEEKAVDDLVTGRAARAVPRALGADHATGEVPWTE
jgi:flagellar export protein FliJ